MKEFFKGKSVFITGHTGFKGACLSRVLHSFGAEVTGFALPPDRQEKQIFFEKATEGVISIFGDIRDMDALTTAITVAEPEIIFHLAKQCYDVENKANSLKTVYETNFMGTVNLLEAAKECENLRSIVVIDFDKIYNKNNNSDANFDLYSENKSDIESLVKSYRDSFFRKKNIALSSIRFGNSKKGVDSFKTIALSDGLKKNEESMEFQYNNLLKIFDEYLKLTKLQYEDSSIDGAYKIIDENAKEPVEFEKAYSDSNFLNEFDKEIDVFFK